MSELQKTKKELIEILDKIPASGSFEGAELAERASQLIEQLNRLRAEKLQSALLAPTNAARPKDDLSAKK